MSIYYIAATMYISGNAASTQNILISTTISISVLCNMHSPTGLLGTPY